MTKHAYIEKSFVPRTLDIIDQANEIIEEYLADDLRLTLRQLYYQFVARALLENKQSEYKRLGTIISDGRLAGLIDWDAIEDRTRNRVSNPHWSDPGEIIEAAAESFQLDHWQGQKFRPEVWIEKEALAGVIATICEQLDVSYFACKGYVSQSEMWDAAQRLYRLYHAGIVPVIIHLGDHDPSGIDMTRDIVDRVRLLAYGQEIPINRIALNWEQIEEFNPPPNPAKLSDSRANGYISRYGNDSWELDAIDPRTLRVLIRNTVEHYRDDTIYESVIRQEKEYRQVLRDFVDEWEEGQDD